jgi:flagellar biosynthesis GTPase FlhF
MVNNLFLHAFATGQERRNKPESSAAKALLLTSSGAREQESKSARTRARKQEQEKEQEQESKKKNKNKKTRERKRTRTRKQEREQEQEQESKSKREKKQEQEREKEWQNPVPFKENYPPPRTYYSLIGCSPSAQLSSQERQNTWRENCPCTCADYVYHLEHSCQRHLIMANVRAAPNNLLHQKESN